METKLWFPNKRPERMIWNINNLIGLKIDPRILYCSRTNFLLFQKHEVLIKLTKCVWGGGRGGSFPALRCGNRIPLIFPFLFCGDNDKDCEKPVTPLNYIFALFFTLILRRRNNFSPALIFHWRSDSTWRFRAILQLFPPSLSANWEWRVTDMESGTSFTFFLYRLEN